MLQLKRNIKAIFKYKTSSGLALLSMVISFLGVIILTLYVSFEKSFDHFHKSASSIYRLETKEYGSNLPALLGNLISEKVPEVEKLTVLLFDNAGFQLRGSGKQASTSSLPCCMQEVPSSICLPFRLHLEIRRQH